MASPGSRQAAEEQNAAADAKVKSDMASAQASDATNFLRNPSGMQNVQNEDKNHLYQSPGSADYGGSPGAAAEYSAEALRHMGDNAGQQASNASALSSSLSNMRSDRGPQSPGNAELSAKEAATRGEQGKVLDLSMNAAMGGAPSVSDYATRLGMNKISEGAAGASGSARGLSGMSGAQLGAGQIAGANAGEAAYQGGIGRSGEIGQAIGQYGQQAGQMRGQDLTTLGTSNQNAIFNADLNDKWKLGNANLAVGQANLGNSQQGLNQQWFGQSMSPEDIQFQMDQEAQGWQAGANTDAAGAKYAKDNANRQNTQAVAGAITQAALTGVGSLGGPAGAMAGGMAGTAINSATKKYY